jgi:hypothetical protein
LSTRAMFATCKTTCVSAPISDPAPPPHQRRSQSRWDAISTVANILKTHAL